MKKIEVGTSFVGGGIITEIKDNIYTVVENGKTYKFLHDEILRVIKHGIVTPLGTAQAKPRKTKTQSIYSRLKPIIDACRVNSGYIKIIIDNESGYMPLTIEQIGDNIYSIMHFYFQNGDLMCDPDITFKVINDDVQVLTYEQSNLCLYQEIYIERDGKQFYNAKLKSDITDFLDIWSKNIKQQGYIEALKNKVV